MSQSVPWATEFHRVPNRIKVLQLIRAAGPLSRADIARGLQLSRPTASRIVDELMLEGMIETVGKSQPTGGRLGDLYTFRLDAGVVLGLQLGTQDARAALATLSGEILCQTARPLALEKRRSVLPQLRGLIAQTLDSSQHEPKTVLAAGLAVPGVVNVSTGMVQSAPSVFPGLSDRPLMHELEQHLGVPVVMDNDVNFAALGEQHSGCAHGIRDIVFIFVGPGIGAGLILNGELLRGSSGAAGEIGHMVIDRESLYREHASFGSLESIAGIHYLLQAAQARGLPYETGAAVCEQAFAGNPRALQIVCELSEYLAAAVINTVSIIDPEVVVLGGDLAELPHAEELFVRPIEALITLRHVRKCPCS